MEKEELAILIAGLIRANAHTLDDIEHCTTDMQVCLRTHPLHTSSPRRDGGKARVMVFADVDGIAQLIAEGLTSRFVVQT